MRINADTPHVLHYAGPVPNTTSAGEPMLGLAGNSRLDTNAASQLFQAFPKRPLVFLSYYDNKQVGTLPASEMELLAGNLMTAAARPLVTIPCPVNINHPLEFS